jgi:hypothetical protein
MFAQRLGDLSPAITSSFTAAATQRMHEHSAASSLSQQEYSSIDAKAYQTHSSAAASLRSSTGGPTSTVTTTGSEREVCVRRLCMHL